jgi:hypothetical protein
MSNFPDNYWKSAASFRSHLFLFEMFCKYIKLLLDKFHMKFSLTCLEFFVLSSFFTMLAEGGQVGTSFLSFQVCRRAGSP